MNDKTLGEYKRTTPDPDETTGEALARLQAEMTRSLDEADAEPRDEADGGVTAALIEKEAERPLTFAEGLGAASINARQAREAEKDAKHLRDRCAELEHRLHLAVMASDHNSERAEKAERERDEARSRLAEAAKEIREQGETIAELAAEARPLTPDAITDEMVDRAFRATIPHPAASVSEAVIREILTAALTEPPARPEWLDAPAVRAWHKSDGRTERDGTPGKPRIWSPDYGTAETWSTPSLRGVPWTDLVDVEPLDVSADLAEGLDRVAEFMRTGGVRVVGEEQS
ncbi:hypothetical protein [Brachybacterium sp. GPGPB12]|uniref:hypothetical protein n=1 Tax=Brachybacterium sp. GPGPB12 TaxID=3023517 RepID=UPI0031345D5D